MLSMLSVDKGKGLGCICTKGRRRKMHDGPSINDACRSTRIPSQAEKGNLNAMHA